MFFFRNSSPLSLLSLSLLLAISISLCSSLPRLAPRRASVENERGENERRTVLRRKVVVNKDGTALVGNKNEAGNQIEQMRNKTRVAEIGATLKEEEILIGDNLKTNTAEKRNSTTTNTTDGSSPFTSLFLGFPNLPALSELPLGIGWVAGVFDSLLPTVRHTQMPPHILL